MSIKDNIEELHSAVMEIIDDYIDFEYSITKDGTDFSHCETRGNADKGDDVEYVTLWVDDEKNPEIPAFEVTIERGYKQRGTEGEGEDLQYIYDMNYQGSEIEGDYNDYVKWLKEKWPDAYEEAMESE
jgi:hypothetical protein